MMVFSAILLILMISNLNLYFRPANRPIPGPLRWFTLGFLAKILCMFERKSYNQPNNVVNPEEQNGESSQQNEKDMEPKKSKDKEKIKGKGVKTIEVTPNDEEDEDGDEDRDKDGWEIPKTLKTGLKISHNKNEWQMISKILDRFYFAMMILIFLALYITFAVLVLWQEVPTP